MIEVYSTPTANGQKVHILLEETGLAYTVCAVDLVAGEHKSPSIMALNPIGKIPAILDPEGPDGAPIALGETGAICAYLARKAGRFGAETAREAAEIDYWAFAINASLAMPFAMQFYFSQLAPERIEWAIDTFAQGARRTLGAFEDRLAATDYLVGGRFTWVDALLYPHLASSALRLPGQLTDFPSLRAYEARLSLRPGVQRGMAVLAG